MSLKAKTTLAREMPVDARWPDHTRHLLAESLLERRPPGNELKSHAVVEHREPTGSEDDGPAIDPRDMLAAAALSSSRCRSVFKRSRANTTFFALAW